MLTLPNALWYAKQSCMLKQLFEISVFKRSMSGSTSYLEERLAVAAKYIKNANALIFSSGAGMGCDSGLPDFRGPEGFYKAYPLLRQKGLTFPEMSTPHWFYTDPSFAWGFFGHRLNLYRKTAPHQGFHILRRWGEEKELKYFVFTSNVDGQYQKAGYPEERILEVHGTINYLQTVRNSSVIWPVPEGFVVDIDDKTLRAREPLPTGPPDVPLELRSLARPNVLMFNDFDFVPDRTHAQQGRLLEYKTKLREASARCVVIEIGAGLAVPTVRMFSESCTRDLDCALVRINPREADVRRSLDVSLPMTAVEALRKIDEIMKGLKH